MTAIQSLPVQPLSVDAFRPYGQVITASDDGKPYDATDAQLKLESGIPRFYIMRLQTRGRQFHHMTRHHQCTQCLGSLEGRDWLMAVAPADAAATPDLTRLAAFRIPGNCFIKLEVGTWHAGPYFDHEQVDFYNLELSDTNITDHETCDLLTHYGTLFMFV